MNVKPLCLVLGLAFSTCVNAKIILLPEQNRVIQLSNSDANRIYCEAGDINSVVYSKEKPVSVIPGDDKNAYIKFKMKREQGVVTYATDEAEFYITCDGQIYPFIVTPTPMRPVTLVLSPGETVNIKANIDMFSGLSMEEAIIDFMDKVMLADKETPLPSTFTVTQPERPVIQQVYPGVHTTLKESIKVEGVGFELKEYVVSSDIAATLEEMDFVNINYGKNIVGVRLMDLSLSPGQHTRLFIVEREWR